MKKILAFLCSSILIFGTIFSNAFATTDCQVYVAVLCEDEEKGREMVKSMCRERGTFNAVERRVFFTGVKNDTDHCTVVYDGSDDTNYHIDFRVMSKIDKGYLEKCSEAIILYDIADSKLESIVKIDNLILSENIKTLLSLKTPLTKFIDELQYNKWFFIFPGWYDSIDFVSYGKEKLPEEDYKKRRSAINRFTCITEKYYGIDNKWGRGHPDVSSPNFYEYTLFGIVGSAYRSIGEGSVKGTYPPKIQHKESSNTVQSDETTVLLNTDGVISDEGCSHNDAQLSKKKLNQNL